MGEASRRGRATKWRVRMRCSRREFLVLSGASFLSACGVRSSGPGDWIAWGHSGTRDGEFRRPRAIAAANDEVYVIDTSGRMQIFSHDGKYLRGWIMPEYENGTPTGIAFASDGHLLIPDTHYSRILEYTPQGEILQQWGEYGTGEDQFIYPTDIVQAADGGYIISEYGQGAERMHMFDADRHFLRQWGQHGDQPGEFSRAMSLTLCGGKVFVCDTANHRVQCFTLEGDFIRVIGGPGTEDGQLKFPHDIAVGPNETLLICEYGNNRLSRFTTTGDFLSTFGRAGRGPGEFAAPRGVTISPNGYFFVADTDNDRIQRFRLEDLA